MVALTFIDVSSGTNLTTPVSGGTFSIDLPNAAIYDVVARWVGNYSWQAGDMDRGDLTVNMSAGSMGAMSYNLELGDPTDHPRGSRYNHAVTAVSAPIRGGIHGLGR